MSERAPLVSKTVQVAQPTGPKWEDTGLVIAELRRANDRLERVLGEILAEIRELRKPRPSL